MEPERGRAVGVITALLDDDRDLAKTLILSDADPWGLAWGALTIAAGLVNAYGAHVDREPQELWNSTLIKFAAST